MNPKIFGIVNVTEDSFSDGGRYLEPGPAVAHARALVAAGADVIDLGPASSHPDAARVAPDEEIHRIAPIIEALHADGIAVSVDSPLPETQLWALREGVAWVNDIRGFPDSSIYHALAASPACLVVMHQIADRATRDSIAPQAVLGHMHRFFEERIATLEDAGIARARLVLDPGMGFFLGSNPEASLAVLRAIPELKQRFGLPLLVSVSRKSFLRRLTGRSLDEIGPATLAAEIYAARHGVDFVRTHDVAPLVDALRLWRALTEHVS